MTDWTGTNYGEDTEDLPESLTQLSDDFSEFMIEPISISPVVSKDKFGQNIYGFATTVMGIVIQKLVQVSDKDNQIVNSNSQIFVDGNTAINMSDKILFNDIIPEIKYIRSIPDENGIYVKIIYI